MHVGVFAAEGEPLILSDKWKPDHPQNGKTVSVRFRVSKTYRKHISNPYKAPVTGELIYGNKGTVLDAKGKPTSLSLYIKSSEPLEEQADQKLQGRLDISIYQVKGGRYSCHIMAR